MGDWIRYKYIRLLPEFVREVLDAYENWNGKDNVPKKLQELTMVSRSKPHTSTSDTRSLECTSLNTHRTKMEESAKPWATIFF